MSFAFVNK